MKIQLFKVREAKLIIKAFQQHYDQEDDSVLHQDQFDLTEIKISVSSQDRKYQMRNEQLSVDAQSLTTLMFTVRVHPLCSAGEFCQTIMLGGIKKHLLF